MLEVEKILSDEIVVFQKNMSLLENAIKKAEADIATTRDRVDRLRAIANVIQTIQKNGKFSQKEIQELKDSYDVQRNLIIHQLTGATSGIAQAKKMWLDKQATMLLYYQQGILDNKVSAAWNESLQHDKHKIEMLENLLKLE